MNANAKHEYQSMLSVSLTSFRRIAFLAAFAWCIAFPNPSYSASGDLPEQPMPLAGKPTAVPPRAHGHRMDHSPEAMAQRVEERIKNLHQTLGITKEQEAKWGQVAQTMRENEAIISALIETRRKNVENMTAIDNLQSNQAIAQSHVEGIKRMIAAFGTLYDNMSVEQKKAADKTLGHFDGHGGHSSDMKN